MRSLLSLIFGILAFLLSAQPGEGANRTDDNGMKQGPWVRHWADSDQIRYKGAFNGDRPVGRFTYFSTSGVVESIVDHYPGSDASHARHFHSNGQLMAEGRYEGEQKDSIWHFWDQNGVLRSKEGFRSGKPHGDHITYFPDGQVAERITYVQGEREGKHEQFYPDGTPKHFAAYVQGSPDGKMSWFTPKGTKDIEGNMVNGEKDGTWSYFNEDGSVRVMLVFDNGQFVKDKKENGLFKDYYPDDQVKVEERYKNGMLDGDRKEFFDNGQWVERPYTDDRTGRQGEVERVLEGQTIRRKEHYRKGLLHGTVVEYDEAGRELMRTEYVDGMAVGP
ncbi:MAG: hypothetical protein KDB88_07285 [Flavobacteriales bacterium]|nr:hypothetical protein [Flavobacteriales bacterium]